jgi:hypothetical protein
VTILVLCALSLSNSKAVNFCRSHKMFRRANWGSIQPKLHRTPLPYLLNPAGPSGADKIVSWPANTSNRQLIRSLQLGAHTLAMNQVKKISELTRSAFEPTYFVHLLRDSALSRSDRSTGSNSIGTSRRSIFHSDEWNALASKRSFQKCSSDFKC